MAGEDGWWGWSEFCGVDGACFVSASGSGGAVDAAVNELDVFGVWGADVGGCSLVGCGCEEVV